MFNIKINSLNKVTDTEKGIKIYKKDGKTLLEKDNTTYVLPIGTISSVNNEYFIDGVPINYENPQNSYEKL